MSFLAGLLLAQDQPKWTDVVTAVATAAAAIGTVGALVFLAIQAFLVRSQTANLHRQVDDEAKARREDQLWRREQYRAALTPLLLPRVIPNPGEPPISTSLNVQLHPVGQGTAHDVIVNLRRHQAPAANPPEQHIATRHVSFIQADAQTDIPNLHTVDPQHDLGAWFVLEVTYRNMFRETITFRHSLRFHVDQHQWEITDGPKAAWPWEFAHKPN